MNNTKRHIPILLGFIFIVFCIGFPVSAQQTPRDQVISSRLSDYNRLKDCTQIKQDIPKICLQVPIGTTEDVSGIAEYIIVFYKFFVGVIVTLAIFMIVVNGVRWLFARGNSGTIGAAKKGIQSAVAGVVLVFISVALLRIINPDLISLQVPGLKGVERVAGPAQSPDLWPGAEIACSTMASQIQELTDSSNTVIAYPPSDPSRLGCNQSFTVTKYTGTPLALQCYGEYCPGGQECLFDDLQHKFYCATTTQVAGTFHSDEQKDYDVTISLHPVCGLHKAMLPADSTTFSYRHPFGTKTYQFSFSRNDMKAKCGAEAYKGIVIGVSLLNVVERSYLMKSDCQSVFVDSAGAAIKAPGSSGATSSVGLGSEQYLVDRGWASFICDVSLQQSRLPLF